MREFKPLDFTRLCLDGQVKIVTVKEPALPLPPVKASKIPYVIIALSLTALASVIAYYNNLLKKKEQELKKFKEHQNFFSYEA